jgi:hypothetical protein
MMRKLTVSVLGAAAIAGGAFGGAALAAPAASHSSVDRVASVDRSTSDQRPGAADRSRHESSSRDHGTRVREHRASRDR